jgi:predicted AAA+ superfamily ATPase
MQRTNVIERPTYQRLLESYRETEQVKVLQGIRRCGKSTLMELFCDSLRAGGVAQENLFYRRFDMLGMPFEMSGETLVRDVTQALAHANRNETFYVFLDEVQEVTGWEKAVRQLHTAPGVDVYLTGSNARILSSELATLLAGRTVTLDVYPLSFTEYLDFVNTLDHKETPFPSSVDELFARYVRFGGMPSLFSLRTQDEQTITRELSSIFDTVLLNDVAKRLGIRDIALLERLVAYLFSTSGNLFSTRKVTGALTSIGRKASASTVESYIAALRQAFIINEVYQTGASGKELLAPLRKFYPADTGLRNFASRFSSQNLGFQLENVVYLELRRRGFSVKVGVTDRAEIDFVARKLDQKTYVQVSQSVLSEEVRGRELAPLRGVGDSFPKMLLTLDRFDLGTTSDGIRIVNLVDWLREEDPA